MFVQNLINSCLSYERREHYERESVAVPLEQATLQVRRVGHVYVVVVVLVVQRVVGRQALASGWRVRCHGNRPATRYATLFGARSDLRVLTYSSFYQWIDTFKIFWKKISLHVVFMSVASRLISIFFSCCQIIIWLFHVLVWNWS